MTTLTVYGSSACAACKTLLKMAEAQKVSVDYKLIDTDEEALREYQAVRFTNNSLPAVLYRSGDTEIMSSGMTSAMSIIKLAKENNPCK